MDIAASPTCQLIKEHNLDSGVKQARVVTEFFQGSDAGQVCVSLRGALQAGSEHSVAEEVLVQLTLQGGRLAEQRPVQTRWQVAIDDLLGPPQDEHTGQARELSCSLSSQNALLLSHETDMRSGLMPGTVMCTDTQTGENKRNRGNVTSVQDGCLECRMGSSYTFL